MGFQAVMKFLRKRRIACMVKSEGRVNRFGITHAAAFPVGSIATADLVRANGILPQIGPDDSTAGNSTSPATDTRNHLFAEVWEDLKTISGTLSLFSENFANRQSCSPCGTQQAPSNPLWVKHTNLIATHNSTVSTVSYSASMFLEATRN